MTSNKNTKNQEKWNEGLSDERLAVLMSPFKNREVNEVNYDSKMKFWKEAIIAESIRRHKCSYSASELKTWFVYQGRTPMCLLNVIEDMYRDGTIKSKTEFQQMQNQTQCSWSNWAVNTLVKNPLSWSVGKVKNSLVSSSKPFDDKTDYVNLQLVESQANELFSVLAVNEKSLIFFMDDIQKRLNDLWNDDISIQTTELIVHSLEICNKAYVEHGEHLIANKTLVKIAGFGKNVEPISDLEKNFFKLKEAEKILIGEISNLDKEKESLIKEAKMYVAKNMKPIALSYLRKKKEVERRIEKQLNSLDNIQAMVSRIEESKYNSEVLKSYGTGLSALKLSSKDTGLTIDNVDETMAELAEVLEEHRDIQSALGKHIIEDKHNENELEDELADLLNVDESICSSKEKHHVPDLPEVPDNSIENEEFDLDQRFQMLREH
ncbi:charged multivesicular body protein 7 [Daktulosphaira vitifoliae]|uniref:charged multivesicular body protein 7 n=1 Tax=Daktulosphaira vitifoliae TaxID=58002 RepID=UPI0021AA5956|nr:charged multivesicular body protein 7 [Daktulosphaira vitifoliae]XP_050544557.1 charged multivesicular body protein 7 [Daktulosphaira vitifoliae]XP_050544558.1 charged multivesicular body protein 7 [Daktulosphaira vitifoliae]